ncbi:MAG: hypothetical protein K2Q13_02595 [Nitrosomonas sp.]|uniref:RipA family octameric membrane protein n=1 Tax=Nitrosomonas sp. TaxID=42353 RepID=UPI0025DCD8CE|nr:hypothetical protein [Nitrosomonas sp.]MBY0473933.1 hypothetical protein [Nitrosomonas sp.]
MNENQYKEKFSEQDRKEKITEEADTRAGRALEYALDIRKFEIEMYWKRATYFWALIAAAFAAYALTYKTVSDHEPWLSLVFSALGLVLSFAWYLVNRGSKFWQNNWERHVDMLENMTLGPLYKVVAINPGNNPLTDAAQFSVTKINQMLSLFVTLFWIVLLFKSVGPVEWDREVDWYKLATIVLTLLALRALWKKGRSNIEHTTAKLHERTFKIET